MAKYKLPQPTEHAIQTQLMQYLRTKGWYVMRLNSGKFSVGEGAGRRFINGQDAGTPDLMAFIALPTGIRLYFIEVKRPGKKPTPLQKAKMEDLEKYGAHCFVATCIEDLTNELS
jgi:Holliday junction resolvase